MLEVIAGRDPHDSTSADVPVGNYAAECGREVKGLRIGIPKEYFGEGLDPEIRAAIERRIDGLRSAGCEIVNVSLPHTEYAIPIYYIVATAEASANLARFDGVRYTTRSPQAKTLSDMYRRSRDEGFGAEVKRRIMLGTYALSAGYYDAYYLKAQQVRTPAHPRLPECIRKCRCHRHSGDAHHGLQTGREDRRSDGDVSQRHLHGHGQSGRSARHLAALRKQLRRAADRHSDSGQALR